MANAQTEHSKKLRAQTAAEWNRKQIAEGKIRVIQLKMATEIADDFDAIAKQLGVSRPQALKALCECWHQHHGE